MELWVRSQDKKLLCKVDSLFIEEELYKRKGKYRIMANNGWLGEYNTLERALEVLDEIQRILHPTVFMSAEINTDDNNWVENGIIYQKYKDNFKIQELSTYVYEMPKD